MTDYRDCDIPELDPDLPEELLEFSEQIITFNDTYVRNGSLPQELKITNKGKDIFYVKTLKISTNFHLEDVQFPMGLQPEATATVKLGFMAEGEGFYEGEFTVVSIRGYEASVSLQAKAIAKVTETTDDSGSEDTGSSEVVAKDFTHWEELSKDDVSILRAKGDSNVIHAAVLPKSTGGLVGNLVGNERGKYVVDLQFNNLRGTTVAGGDFASITGGKDNTALGRYSFIGSGYSNTNDGDYSVIASGSSAQTDGDYNFIGTAQRTTVEGTVSAVLTANDTTVSGSRSINLVGQNNTVLGNNVFLASGSNVSIDGDNNAVLCGTSTTVTDSGYVLSGVGTAGISNSNYIAVLSANTASVKDSTNVLFGSGDNLTVTEAENVFVGSGTRHVVENANNAVICTGLQNTISNSKNCFIGASENILLSSTDNSCVLVGTGLTLTNSANSVITSGEQNSITDSPYSVILTGEENAISGTEHALVLSGTNNKIEGADNDYSVIVNGLSNSINNSSNALLSGSNNQISGSSLSCILNGTGNSVVSAYASGILAGDNNTVQASNSAIIAGSYNQILGEHSVVLGGNRNTIEGNNNVALGGNYGTDMAVTHHVFMASKEGTNYVKDKLDPSTGYPTGEEPSTSDRTDWVNYNPLVQTGTMLMQAMEDPSKGFYEGTSEYKKCFYTHSDKYVTDNIWGDLPKEELNKTVMVPSGCALFWKMEISLFNFLKNEGTVVLCQNGIISCKDNQLSVVNEHTAKTLDTEFTPNTLTKELTAEESLIVTTNDEDLSVTFELPVAYKDYIAAGKLSYTLLTDKSIDFYWE